MGESHFNIWKTSPGFDTVILGDKHPFHYFKFLFCYYLDASDYLSKSTKELQ